MREVVRGRVDLTQIGIVSVQQMLVEAVEEADGLLGCCGRCWPPQHVSHRCRRHLLFLPMLLAPAIDTVQLKHCGGSLGSFYNSIAQIWQQEIIEESHHEVDIQPRRLCCPVFVRWRTSLVSF